jgi:LmbE family N-acetylglucosaminyl deacetylase
MMRAGDILDGIAGLPEADLCALVGERFAVIAPHPDDESLGCGGMIAEACQRRLPPEVVVLTDGAASHPGSAAFPPPVLATVRRRETRRAAACLGLPAEKLHFLGVPDGGAAHDAAALADMVQKLCVLAAGCETLLVSWRHDPHGDHVTAYMVARAAAQTLGARVLEYPVWGLTLDADTALPERGWRGWRVPVAAHLAAKRRAVACHASQHGLVVKDDPDGFVLPPAFLRLFDREWEILMEAA